MYKIGELAPISITYTCPIHSLNVYFLFWVNFLIFHCGSLRSYASRQWFCQCNIRESLEHIKKSWRKKLQWNTRITLYENKLQEKTCWLKKRATTLHVFIFRIEIYVYHSHIRKYKQQQQQYNWKGKEKKNKHPYQIPGWYLLTRFAHSTFDFLLKIVVVVHFIYIL